MTNDNEYVPLVVRTSTSFLHSRLIASLVCNYINTTDTTSGADTDDLSGAPELTPGFY